MKLNDLESQGFIERVEPNPGSVDKALHRAQRDLTVSGKSHFSQTAQKCPDARRPQAFHLPFRQAILRSEAYLDVRRNDEG
jgi:hypothetical protein